MHIEREYALNELEFVVAAYNMILRTFKVRFNWMPNQVDEMRLRRIMNIYDDTLEEIQSEKEKINE